MPVSAVRRAARFQKRNTLRAARGGINRAPTPAPPPRHVSAFARRGREAAEWVKGQPTHRKVLFGAGALTAGAVVRNTGRPTDNMTGRPTGIYGY